MRLRRLWGPIASLPAAPPPGSSGALFLILAVAFATRIGLAWFVPSIQQADEIYQVVEQANRAANGFGIVSWEFQSGSRAAILPALLTPIYALPVSARAHQMLASAFFSALSLIPIAVAFLWAGRLYGRRAAVVAAVVMATWFELFYFAPKATADVVCSYFFIASVYLARPGASRQSIFAGAAALLFALGLRVQIAPAVVLTAWTIFAAARREHRVTVVAGAMTGAAVVGAIEWWWWGAPFHGQIGYLRMEFSRHVSAAFAREPITFFLKNAVLFYGGLLPVLAFLAWRGARQAPVVLLCAACVVIPFHFVGHKEYRFVLPALPLVMLVAGLAIAELAAGVDAARWPRVAAVACAGWITAVGAMSWSDAYRPFWTQDTNRIVAFREIGAQPDACGVALVSMRWWHTPGYSGIGRDVPIYEVREDEQLQRLLSAANYVLAGPKASPPPPPFVPWRAYTRPVEYAYRREGACVPAPELQVVNPPAPDVITPPAND